MEGAGGNGGSGIIAMKVNQKPSNSSVEPCCDIVQIWPLYFPQIELSFQDWRYLLISKFACFFATPRGKLIVSQVFVFYNQIIELLCLIKLLCCVCPNLYLLYFFTEARIKGCVDYYWINWVLQSLIVKSCIDDCLFMSITESYLLL